MGYGKKKRFNSQDKKIPKCYGCKKIGHWKRDCPNKSGNNSSANVVQSDGSCNKEELLCVSSTKCTDVWIIDYGGSYHMTFTGSDSTLLNQVNLVLSIYVMIKLVPSLERGKLKLLWVMVACAC